MAFLSQENLEQLGFKKLGVNVKISDKASIYNHDQIEVGDNSRIDDFCVVSGKIKIGRNVHFAVFCNVAGGELGIEFSDFSGLAYGCHVFTQSDDYTGLSLTNPTIPDQYKKERKEKVKIGRHVIVGTMSIIFPGVEIADGCSVGAMTLVNRSTEPWGIYVGNPARRVKNRHQDLLKFEIEYVSKNDDSI